MDPDALVVSSSIPYSLDSEKSISSENSHSSGSHSAPTDGPVWVDPLLKSSPRVSKSLPEKQDDFEMALDAMTIETDSPATGISGHPQPPEQDPTNPHSSSEQEHGLSRSFESTGDPINQSPTIPTAENHGDSPKPAAPIRPPPFRPRPPAKVVAASDIHALLDSFPASTTPPNPPPMQAPPESDVGSKEESFTPEQQSVVDEGPSDTNQTTTTGNLPTAAEPTESTKPEVSTRDHITSPSVDKYMQPPTLPSVWKADPTRSHHGRQLRCTSARRSRSRAASSASLSLSFGFKCALGAVVALLAASACYFSTFSFGIFLGVVCTLIFVRIRDFLCSRHPSKPVCPLSGFPMGDLCCSLHCHSNPSGLPNWPVYAPAFPPLGLRNLQSFSVPYMVDEDPSSSSSAGPLGSSLGFKLDRNERPVYKGWMNQSTNYDPETHHVNQTHSIYVTLDGTQLQLRRPKRNIARRSMWNEELPSVNSTRFHTERTFDLTHAQVVLLPAGLVTKRLWSKKYPISITFTSQPQEDKEKMLADLPRTQSLFTSTSVPNMDALHTQYPTSKPDSPIRQSSVDVNGTTSENGFFIVSHEDTSVVLYLFGRTCREKEAWFRRFRAASLGVPLLWTPQLAVQKFLAGTRCTNPRTADSRSDDEVRSEPGSIESSTADATSESPDKSALITPSPFAIPGTREPLYVTYVRYMAKFMPATWLLRGSQALHVNVNHITCDTSLIWLNAFLARMFWDFLREAYWLERVREKIQAKLKKIHLPPFISELIVVGIELGTELPVIRHISRPHLDAHGLWFELDVAYAGGFSVALETNVNLMRWNQRNRIEWEAANLADDTNDRRFSTVSIPEYNQPRKSNRLGAFVSDEEDSADSTTDSDTASEVFPPTSLNSSRRSSAVPHSGATPAGAGYSPGVARNPNEDRSASGESSFQLPTALRSRKRIIRIMDRITKSTYFQKAVDNKLVQRGMELLSNTPIVLEAEVQSLSGTLLVNIPPPPSDRLWYGFRPNPQLRIKARPRVGEKAVTMSRILEWIENRVALEFQRLVVLPNMDDVPIPLLLSDVVAGGTK